jgi:hypothetical protein
MRFLHNLSGRLVAEPGPACRPPITRSVARVPYRAARRPWTVAHGPRARGPGALVRGPRAELADLAEPRHLPGVCMYMHTGPAAPWCLHLHANRPPPWCAPWWPRAGGRRPGGRWPWFVARVPGAGGRRRRAARRVARADPHPPRGPKKWPPAQAAPALARFHTLNAA